VSYQRKHQRYPIDTPASVAVLGLEEHGMAARVGDISERGLKLITDIPLTLGETLRVEIETEVLVGVARNSEAAGNGYSTGVELLNSIERTALQSLLDEWAVEV
jgi:hypothetical protein